MNALLRAPVVTATSLAKTLGITPQAALGLLRQLTAAGIVREAAGRASWRVFALCR
jgi:predicted transcriptional regulator